MKMDDHPIFFKVPVWISIFVTLLIMLITVPVFAQNKSVQTTMGSLGSDWQAMETAKNHVVAGIQELQSLATELETKNKLLSAEIDRLKKENEDLKKKK